MYHPGPIAGGGTVDEIVRTTGYIAAIGGDTHNYQRYPIQVGDRVIVAEMQATGTIVADISAAANNAFDGFQKATRQATEVAEANYSAMTAAATKPAAKAKRG